MPEYRRRNRSARPLNYQRCEPRLLLAGNVNVHANGDHLYIRGDSSDNQIEVFGGNGTIVVRGLEGTLINGGEEGYRVEASRPVIYEYNGLYRANQYFTPSVFDGGLRANMGDGDDSIRVYVSQFEAESFIYGGIGDDNVEVHLSTFEDSLVIQTFSGNDSVSMRSSSVGDSFYALLLDGDDVYESDGFVSNAISVVTTGKGNDRIVSVSDRYQGTHQFVLAGAGNDLIEVDDPMVNADGLQVYGGAGDDHFRGSLPNEFSDGKVIFGGQGGDDVGDFDYLEFDPDVMALNTFETINHAAIRSATYNQREFAEAVDSGNTPPHFGHDVSEAAGRFSFDESTSVSRVGWSGTYEQNVFYDDTLESWETSVDVPDTDDFVVKIFEGNNGRPSETPLLEFFVGDNVNREDQSYLSLERFDYSADLDSNLELEGGKDYWFSVFSINEVGSRFQWLIGDAVAGNAGGYAAKDSHTKFGGPMGEWEIREDGDVPQDLVFSIWTETSSERLARGSVAFNN